MGDKKPGVRKAARDGLCALYKAHSIAHLTEYTEARTVPEELHCIPKMLMHCYGVDEKKDVESKVELEQLLFATILPMDEPLRLRAVCSLHAALLPYQRKALRALLRSRHQCQMEVVRWLELHEKMRSRPDKANNNNQDEAHAKGANDPREEQAKLVAMMCKRLPHGEKAKEVWSQIIQTKDQKVPAQLRVIASSGSNLSEIISAQKELRKRMSSRLKESQLPTLTAIASLPAMTLLWPDGVSELIDEVVDELTNRPNRCDKPAAVGGLALPILEMLNDFACLSPVSFGTSGQGLANALKAAASPATSGRPSDMLKPIDPHRRPALILLLKLVHATSIQLEQAGPAIRKPIVNTLCELCCTCQDPEIGKLSAHALSSRLLVTVNREATFKVLLNKLTPAMDPSDPNEMQTCALSVVGAFAKRDASILGPIETRLPLLTQLMDAALPPELNSAKKGKKKASKEGLLTAPDLAVRCAAQLLIIKALANEAIGGYQRPEKREPLGETSTSPTSSPEAQEGRSSAEVSAHQEAFVSRLIACLDQDGMMGAAAEGDNEKRSELRLGCGLALLKMLRLPALNTEKRMGPLGWHRLAIIMHDPEVTVRKRFAEKIVKEAKRLLSIEKRETKAGSPVAYRSTRLSNLPPQFISILALAALDPERPHVLAAKTGLVTLVNMWRRCASQWNRPHCLPENQLQYLIHTLAHHPDYEIEEAEANAMDATNDSTDLVVHEEGKQSNRTAKGQIAQHSALQGTGLSSLTRTHPHLSHTPPQATSRYLQRSRRSWAPSRRRRGVSTSSSTHASRATRTASTPYASCASRRAPPSTEWIRTAIRRASSRPSPGALSTTAPPRASGRPPPSRPISPSRRSSSRSRLMAR